MKSSPENKKPKKVYSYVLNLRCPRCGTVTTHSLFDSEKGIYKCLLCKTVHAK